MIRPADLVASNLYDHEDEVWKDALRALTLLHPEYKREIAINLHQKREISLAKAAHLAGLTLEEMKEVLRQRGDDLHLGPDTVADAEEETNSLRESLGESPRK